MESELIIRRATLDQPPRAARILSQEGQRSFSVEWLDGSGTEIVEVRGGYVRVEFGSLPHFALLYAKEYEVLQAEQPELVLAYAIRHRRQPTSVSDLRMSARTYELTADDVDDLWKRGRKPLIALGAQQHGKSTKLYVSPDVVLPPLPFPGLADSDGEVVWERAPSMAVDTDYTPRPIDDVDRPEQPDSVGFPESGGSSAPPTALSADQAADGAVRRGDLLEAGDGRAMVTEPADFETMIRDAELADADVAALKGWLATKASDRFVTDLLGVSAVDRPSDAVAIARLVELRPLGRLTEPQRLAALIALRAVPNTHEERFRLADSLLVESGETGETVLTRVRDAISDLPWVRGGARSRLVERAARIAPDTVVDPAWWTGFGWSELVSPVSGDLEHVLTGDRVAKAIVAPIVRAYVGSVDRLGDLAAIIGAPAFVRRHVDADQFVLVARRLGHTDSIFGGWIGLLSRAEEFAVLETRVAASTQELAVATDRLESDRRALDATRERLERMQQQLADVKSESRASSRRQVRPDPAMLRGMARLASIATTDATVLDPTEVEERVDAVLTETGLRRFGTVGERVPFDRARHDTPERDVDPGTEVEVIRPGFMTSEAADSVVVERAVVRAVAAD